MQLCLLVSEVMDEAVWKWCIQGVLNPVPFLLPPFPFLPSPFFFPLSFWQAMAKQKDMKLTILLSLS
jgi:hypothetical protein